MEIAQRNSAVLGTGHDRCPNAICKIKRYGLSLSDPIAVTVGDGPIQDIFHAVCVPFKLSNRYHWGQRIRLFASMRCLNLKGAEAGSREAP